MGHLAGFTQTENEYFSLPICAISSEAYNAWIKFNKGGSVSSGKARLAVATIDLQARAYDTNIAVSTVRHKEKLCHREEDMQGYIHL
jgi:hypothetical protein